MAPGSTRPTHHLEPPENLADRTIVVRAFGLLLLLLGLAAAAFGPIEVYPLYLFSQGGRFHYEGFQVGSFMFGNIAVQIAGYYVAACILIPLGYGHIRLRNWARRLMLAYTWCWVILGLPLGLVLLFTLYSVKVLSMVVAVAIAICVALSYAILPWLIMRIYNGRRIRHAFRSASTNTTWLDGTPLPILVLVILFVLYAVFLHIPLLFDGLFPFFGSWLSELQGMAALDACIILLLVLTWATASRLRWAWWADLVYFIVLTSSSVVTLAQTTLADLLALSRFPQYEVQILRNMPIRPLYLAAFVGVPLIATVVTILNARTSFGQSMNTQSATSSTIQEEHI